MSPAFSCGEQCCVDSGHVEDVCKQICIPFGSTLIEFLDHTAVQVLFLIFLSIFDIKEISHLQGSRNIAEKGAQRLLRDRPRNML